MGEISYYKIHDFVTISAEFDISVPEYFATGPIADPDIEASVGAVRYNPGDRRQLGDKYFWDPDTKSLSVDWGKTVRAEIRNLTGQTEITVTRLFERLGDAADIVQSTFVYHLLQQDVTILHGAGLRDEHGNGVMIQGWPNMGKTSTSVAIAQHYQCDFLGDDSVLIDGKDMYSYPRNIGISPNTIFPDEELTQRERIERKLRSINDTIPLTRFSSFLPTGRMSVRPERVFTSERVVGTEPVETTHCFFLHSPAPGGDLREFPVDRAQRCGVINSLLKGEAGERTHHLVHAYQYLDSDVPLDMVTSKHADLMADFFEEVEAFEITTPKEKYTETIVNEMDMSPL